MVVDTSAPLAICFDEPESDAFAAALADAERRCISTVSVFEGAMVVESRFGPAGVQRLNRLIEAHELDIRPFDADQLRAARDAFLRYGKGRHPARLNLGDCCAYALAATIHEPLLYKGNDFQQTDIETALGSAE